MSGDVSRETNLAPRTRRDSPFLVASKSLVRKRTRAGERAPVVGNDRAGPARRRNGGDTNMPKPAGLKGTPVVPKTTVVPRRPVVGRRHLSERQAAAELSVILHHYSAGQLARITGRTKDAAKKWRSGDACPNTPTLLSLGREIDGVRDWINDELSGGPFTPQKPEDVNALALAVAAVIQQSMQAGSGRNGAEAREAFAQINRLIGKGAQ